jgi:transposase
MSNICSYYGVKPNTYGKFYKKKQSDFSTWDQLSHSKDYLLFPENIGPNLSIDEVSVSKGELYTFVTNKAAKGKKGTIVACIADTKAEKIKEVLEKLSIEQKNQVIEVTLDMAPNMSKAIKDSFPKAKLVTDRFHVVRLALEALQHLRTNLRWKEMETENNTIEKAKETKEKYLPQTLQNGDTPKQLLARSKYILAKKESQWTENQKIRASLLFTTYPQIKTGYDHVIKLRSIYEERVGSDAAVRLKKWIEDSRRMENSHFLTVANSLENHFDTIINFFTNRSTNANAESFNSKIKLFRANQRGVVDTKFFLFRLYKLFA